MSFISRLFTSKQETTRALTLEDFPFLGNRDAVSVQSAMAIPAVYAAVSNVADTISTLPLPVMKVDEVQGAVKNYQHPIYRLLNKAPNRVQTAKAFRAAMVIDLMTEGEHFSEIIRDGYGTPVELWRISKHSVRTEWHSSGRYLRFFVGEQELQPEDLIHVVSFSLDGLRGTSPFSLCKESLSLTIQMENYGRNFFHNSARPGGFLTLPPGLKPEDRDEARRQWAASNSGTGNTGKTAILPSGFSWSQTSLDPQEGQLNEGRIMQLRECQRITRTPPAITNDYERQTFNNIEYSGAMYVQNTIRPLVVAIEQELNKKLLDYSDEFYVEHTLEGLLRGSPSEQIEMLSTAVGGAFYTPNEARRIMGLPAHVGGTELNTPKAAFTAQDTQGGNDGTKANANEDN